MATQGKSRAVFLDRDGVLNDLVVRDGVGVSPRLVEDFRVREEAIESVRRLRELGLFVFVATNQPDVARGLLDPRDLEEMTRLLQSAVCVKEIVVCPHDDRDDCACRKPRPGMLVALAERWQVDLSKSFLVGDSWKDIEAGNRAGCCTILMSASPDPAAEADAVVPSLSAAVAVIESYL